MRRGRPKFHDLLDILSAPPQGDSGLAIQREVMEYVKDAYHHVKDLVKKKEPGEEDSGEEWEKPSEEVALHAQEAFDLGAVFSRKWPRR